MRIHAPTSSVLRHLIWGLTFSLWAVGSAYAGQVAVDDLVPSEKVQPELSKELTQDLIQALHQIPDLAILSKLDIEAALELNPTLRPPDCEPKQCFFETSSNFESEFMITGTLGRLGRKWIASLTLTHLEKNTVVRQSTGARTGDDSAAKDAVLNAVRNLFREKLPSHLEGPRSLSRLGFQAATAGFAKKVRTPQINLKADRRQIILDLIKTELEYDVAPKIDILDNISRNEIAQLKLESFLAPSGAIFLHHMKAQQMWRTIREDLNRVREIRARARTLGIQPSARPLRFETPVAIEWPAKESVDAYVAAASPAAATIETLLQGWQTGDAKIMESVYSTAHQTALNYRLGLWGNPSSATTKRFTAIAFHNLSPGMLEAALEAHSRGELLIYLAELEGETVKAASRVFLIREDESWKVRHW